ncbi:hypothetical protein SNEBB_011342 [Seison nebaliae]|nr:hypothetical protein SNEBB_011342 [Seison nebaliae]
MKDSRVGIKATEVIVEFEDKYYLEQKWKSKLNYVPQHIQDGIERLRLELVRLDADFGKIQTSSEIMKLISSKSNYIQHHEEPSSNIESKQFFVDCEKAANENHNLEISTFPTTSIPMTEQVNMKTEVLDEDMEQLISSNHQIDAPIADTNYFNEIVENSGIADGRQINDGNENYMIQQEIIVVRQNHKNKRRKFNYFNFTPLKKNWSKRKNQFLNLFKFGKSETVDDESVNWTKLSVKVPFEKLYLQLEV